MKEIKWKVELLIMVPLFFMSCTKAPDSLINLDGEEVLIFTHAGQSCNYPKNSFEAIKKAIDMGVDGVEVDVQATADSQLVLFHDARLEKITSGEGYINQMVWDSIRLAKYNKKDVSVIRLDTLIEVYGTDIIYSLDVKFFGDQDLTKQINFMAETIERYYLKYDIQDEFLIESTSKKFLEKLFLKPRDYRMYFYSHSIDSAIALDYKFPIEGVSISNTAFDFEDVKKAHDQNLKVMTWEIYNWNANNKALAKHVDIIQSDALKDILKKANKYQKPE